MGSAGDDIKEAFEEVGDVFVDAANTVADGVVDTANTVAEGVTDVANTVADGVVDTANTVADGVVDTGNTVAEGVTDVANTVADGVVDTANTVADGVVDTGNNFVNGAVSAWAATSDQAKVLVEEVEKSGMVIGNGFIDGANAVKDATELACEKIVEGAVELGNYVSQHACDIAIGCALSAVFVALAAEGEEEVAVSAILAATIAGAGLQVAARGLSIVVVEPVWLIPGVSDINLTKEQFEDVISFIIVKACGDSPKLLVGTAGQFLVGVLIYGITSLICEGVIPGGYEVWSGAQNSIDRTEQ